VTDLTVHRSSTVVIVIKRIMRIRTWSDSAWEASSALCDALVPPVRPCLNSCASLQAMIAFAVSGRLIHNTQQTKIDFTDKRYYVVSQVLLLAEHVDTP
jgi:hypothetical protein